MKPAWCQFLLGNLIYEKRLSIPKKTEKTFITFRTLKNSPSFKKYNISNYNVTLSALYIHSGKYDLLHGSDIRFRA